MSLDYRFRPLSTGWPNPTRQRRSSGSFKAGWTSTLDLLERELGYLAARHIVIEADFAERDIRNDGMVRADARNPSFPGVRIAFDSKHGPLVYATDAYYFWQHNVRAIALGLEALRAVDRYGVTKRGEQYTGWKQLPSGIAMPAAMSSEDAARFLLEHGDDGSTDVELVIESKKARDVVYKRAATRLHPDAGGGTALFQRLQEARRVLEAAS